MTVEARDATDWTVLKDWSGPVIGYVDGPKSMWPAEAWQFFQGRPAGHITVLADQSYEIFDFESGNASIDAVATAVANRLQSGVWSVVYAGENSIPSLLTGLRSKSVTLTDAGYWPKPGVYLFCADPDGKIAAGTWSPPVDPLAVQHTWAGTYDQSTCYSGWLAPTDPAPVVPPGTPPVYFPAIEEESMLIGNNKDGALIVVGKATDDGHLLVFTETGPGVWSVQDVTDQVHNENPADPRSYQID